MALLLLSANHHDLDLADIEQLGGGVGGVGTSAWLERAGARGAVVLATCNRAEVYLDTDDPGHAAREALSTIAAGAGRGLPAVTAMMRDLRDDDAVRHLFQVSAGLDSMVVGEREIAGQVRRSLEDARRAGTTSPLLERTLQHAARAAREVALATDLARAGRSIVSVALDLAAAHAEACRRHWQDRPEDPHAPVVPTAALAGARAVLVGTGSYAGASLAALRERGCADVAVWSGSGRATGFAARHGAHPVPPDGLAAALRAADVVVACRGTGTPVLGTAEVAGAVEGRTGDPLVLVDLALRRDVTAAVSALPGVVVVDLETVRQHTPAATAADVARARELVDEAVRRYALDTEGRAVDHAVVALRATVDAAVAEEVQRLPAGETMTVEQAARALRRLAARLAHAPTVRARTAAQEGRTSEHLLALEQVLGVPVAGARPEPGVPALPDRQGSPS